MTPVPVCPRCTNKDPRTITPLVRVNGSGRSYRCQVCGTEFNAGGTDD